MRTTTSTFRRPFRTVGLSATAPSAFQWRTLASSTGNGAGPETENKDDGPQNNGSQGGRRDNSKWESGTLWLDRGTKSWMNLFFGGELWRGALWAQSWAFLVWLWMKLWWEEEKQKSTIDVTLEGDGGQVNKFLRILDNARSGRTTPTVVVTGQRGQGKTTSAKAAALKYRSWKRDSWAESWPWASRPRVYYINGKAALDGEPASKASDLLKKTIDEIANTDFKTSYAFVTGLVSTAAPISLPLKVLHSALLGSAYYVLWRDFNRHILIIDDVTQGAKPSDFAAYGNLLEHIKSLRVPVVLVSSNEGIDKCFRDTAPRVVNTVRLPHFSTETAKTCVKDFWLDNEPEFEAKVRGTADKKKKAMEVESVVKKAEECLPEHDASSATSEAQSVVEKAEKCLPEHHAYSARWYPLFSRPELLSWVGGTQLQRRKLFAVAKHLDLQTEIPARAISLGASPPLSLGDVEKLRRLVGASKEVFDRDFPPDCPRRLGLLWALVVTCDTPDSKEMADLSDLKETLAAAANPGESKVKVYYNREVLPLLERIDTKLDSPSANKTV